MTDQTEAAAPRLWTREGFVEDSWRHIADGEDVAAALAGNSRVILPLRTFLAAHEAHPEARERLGVLLMPADDVEEIAPFLAGLPLVALAFPAYNDGRSYSKAALLRTRHDYAGTVRATGDVLPDQISHMLRTGFDALEVTHPVALKRLEEGRIDGLGLYYQPASDKTEIGERYSWRRLPGAKR